MKYYRWCYTELKMVLLLAISMLAIQSFAQEANDKATIEKSYQLLIPNLNVLIDSALANNGMLGYRKDEIDVKKANLKMKKRYWTRNFGIQGDARYGTFDNFSQNVTGPSTVQLASTTIQTNYGVGVYLKIPVFDIYNRKSDIKQAKAELSQAEHLVKNQEDEIKEKVIMYYEDLLLKQRLLRIRAINLIDAKVNLEMAKKEYTNGQIPIYEYIRISDITSGIETEFEKGKSALNTAKRLLENLCGVTIN